ncbi:ATP-binding cassette domain-containing protein [Microbacterium sp. BWT-G7]|uniref:ATP-binding cassette domain-containing protein n=2 Tax=Microbacterium allomyrinae TaxID=2830666 RepID=A0A9X1LYP7_9MICO|nr:ATP-binding cassette domain-containing protein [Microbacterium allomyrinae]
MPASAPVEAVHPGPPPPLPTDLDVAAIVAAGIVVPPRPPLPPAPLVSGDDEAEAEAEAEAVVEAEAEAVVEADADVAEADAGNDEADAGAESEPDVESIAERDADLDVATESEPEPDALPEPGAAPESDALPESDTASDLETTPETGIEPVGEPETLAEPDADAGPESVLVAPAVLPAAAGDVLVLRGVSKRFGSTHAVEGIDLTVPAGTFYGLVGPNGAGKTTTLSMIAGLLQPDHGSIQVGGVDAAAKPLAAKKLMGVLPDRLRTFDRLSGRQLLYYYGVLRGLPAAAVESRTADLARAFDLEDALGRSVSDYSAGMLKKVMLAGALIHSPRLLVLDEPFEAVDPVSSAIILDILSAYVAHGGTVILSSHGMEFVERVCTRVAVIVAGQVLAEGTVDEVRGELTLEQRFVELAGGLSDVEGLEWLHTFSD